MKTGHLVWGIGLLMGIWSFFNSTAMAESKRTRIVYQKNTEVDLDGSQIEGELKNPAEFYFQHRPEEKFDSLIHRRKNFHREMLRDVMMSK